MDAFYCGVEQRHNPSLIGEPFIVLQKNVAATVSYPARALGIKKLENIESIKEKFPDIITVNGESLSKYRAAGLQILEFLQETFPEIERLGLEEFRFEITEHVGVVLKRLRRVFRNREIPGDEMEEISFTLGEEIMCPNFYFEFDGISYPEGYTTFTSAMPPEMYIAGHYAQHLKEKIKLELGYDCSIGVASSKNYAKMVCALNKPHGISVLVPGQEYNFLQERTVESVPGLGFALPRQLLELGIDRHDTIKKLHDTVSREKFIALSSETLWDLTMGIDSSDVTPWMGPTQISKEETFSPNILPRKCLPVLQMLAESLLVQANEEVILAGQWVRKPSKLRVITSDHNTRFHVRKSKTLSLRLEDEVLFKQLETMIVRKGFSMLQELTSEPIRVLNLAFLFK